MDIALFASIIRFKYKINITFNTINVLQILLSSSKSVFSLNYICLNYIMLNYVNSCKYNCKFYLMEFVITINGAIAVLYITVYDFLYM